MSCRRRASAPTPPTVGWARWSKEEIGRYRPGTEEWQARFGRLLGCRDPHARLTDMDALGIADGPLHRLHEQVQVLTRQN